MICLVPRFSWFNSFEGKESKNGKWIKLNIIYQKLQVLSNRNGRTTSVNENYYIKKTIHGECRFGTAVIV